MKFSSYYDKQQAVREQANALGAAVAALKYEEWRMSEVSRAYCPENDAPVVADVMCGGVPQSYGAEKKDGTVVVAATVSANEEKPTKKRGRPAKSEEAKAAPAVEEAKAAPVVEETVTATIDDIRAAMAELHQLYGGQAETRAAVVEVLKKATGVSMTKELAPENYGIALKALKDAIAEQHHREAI